jgi:hypothetical protein
MSCNPIPLWEQYNLQNIDKNELGFEERGPREAEYCRKVLHPAPKLQK